ncbi:hypothetical protein ACH49_14990 [Streptomyces leeuwenhoekii]|uniref:Secreted Protein n=1 Tax=Streptomyces leeuwenhoekii TaxID=1437453 RepID=A0ABR5HY83_STRLW|nr:hypothetical protein [Streptomyces leeuwenhoekii]KMS78731.1 hypothetical protein ACH49_14990 [Streptomyces leeuwenhoekii]
MRLPARRIAASAFCATLLLAVTGPAATAADGDSVRERTSAASRAPLPDVGALTAQVQSLSGLGGVVAPVSDLLGAVLKADDGRLTKEQAEQFSKAVEDALAKAQATGMPIAPEAAAPGTTTPDTATPGTTAPGVGTPAQPPVALQPPAVAQPNDDAPATTLPAPLAPAPLAPAPAAPAAVAPAADESGTASTGLIGAALDALRKSIETLIGASTSAQPEQVSPAAAGVVTDVVNVVAATLFGGGLPAPDLAGLPPLPAAPNGTTPANTPADTPVNAPATP